jgi:hypothetical protein
MMKSRRASGTRSIGEETDHLCCFLIPITGVAALTIITCLCFLKSASLRQFPKTKSHF